MKNNHFLLSALFLITGSMHAMKDVQIVPFDYTLHHQAVCELHTKTLAECTKPIIFKTEVDLLPIESCQLLFKGEKLIGYIYHTIKQQSNERTTSIGALAIAPEYQKKGFGTLLLQTAEKHALEKNCTRISLSALCSTIDFYKKRNFSINKDELTTSESEVVMIKKITRDPASGSTINKQKLDTSE